MPVRDANGDVSRAVVTLIDITERKERERELELFRTLLDHSTDSLLVVDPETGEYLDVNDTACRRRGYTREELLQQTVPDLQTDIPDLAAWQSLVEDLQAEGSITFDGRHRRKDGSTYPVEINATYIELSDEYVIALARDVSDRRQRDRELERMERRFEAIFEDPNILVGLLEPDGTVLDINQTAMEYIDADLDEVTGKPFWETPWWGEGDEVQTDVQEWVNRAAAGEYVEFETDLTRPDGQRYTLNGAFRPVTNDEGDVVSVIVSDRDVTERREYEQKLEASNERLEQFAYAASHDLQEPLRMVSSYLQLIDSRYADAFDEDGREYLEFAVDGAERMRNMIQGLLEYSRVDTRGAPFEPVDLNDVMADVRNDLQVKIAESDAEITSGELPRVDGDAGQLRQLFQNLLDNAIEYSGEEPPRVEISAERNGEDWVISVSDSGIGIDPDEADRIFEVFQRFHAPDEHAGTGIGLALCQRIVERHGGEIWVESEPGDGSTFKFTIPSGVETLSQTLEDSRSNA
jgi:PAS domain S-box-containing protein